MPQRERHWRLILCTTSGRNRLAAVPVFHNDTLPALIERILQLSRSCKSTRSRLLFKPVAHIVMLAQPSELRFRDLQVRQDLTAFNNEAFEAVFTCETFDKFMTAALRNPWHFGSGVDFVEYYSEQLSDVPSYPEETAALETKQPAVATVPGTRSKAFALMISYEISPFALLVLLTITVLAVTTALCVATILATGNGKFAIGLGIAVATIAVAYASFASDVYSLVG